MRIGQDRPTPNPILTNKRRKPDSIEHEIITATNDIVSFLLPYILIQWAVRSHLQETDGTFHTTSPIRIATMIIAI